MDPKRKNAILLAVALVLLAGAVVVGFWDSLFTGRDTTSPEVRAAVEDAAKNAEPPPAEAPTSNFHKQARQVGGN